MLHLIALLALVTAVYGVYLLSLPASLIVGGLLVFAYAELAIVANATPSGEEGQ